MTTNKYDNLDFCLDTAYNFFYDSKDTVECYRYHRIQISEIKPINIKKEEFDYKKIIEDLKLKYEGSSHGRSVYKMYPKGKYPATFRVGLYNKKNTNLRDMKRGELVDMTIQYILTELLVTEKFKFILIPIMNFDVPVKELISNPVIKNNLTKANENSTAYVQILEHYYSLSTLKEYLNSNDMTNTKWKVLIFQVLYALFRIGERFDNFRHNSLDLESIYIYTKKTNSSTNTFEVKDKLFLIPNEGFEIKITNFQQSCIRDIIDNRDIPSIKKEENLYYDVHYFLHSLLNYFSDSKKHKMPESVKTLIDSIIPQKFRDNNVDFIGLNEINYKKEVTNIFTPMLILTKNNFFAEFIKRIMNSRNSSVTNSPVSDTFYGGVDSDIAYSESLTHASNSPLLLAKDMSTKKKGKGRAKKGSSKKGGKRNSSKKKVTGTRKLNKHSVEENVVESFSEAGLDLSNSPINRASKKSYKLSETSSEGGGRSANRYSNRNSNRNGNRYDDDDYEDEDGDDDFNMNALNSVSEATQNNKQGTGLMRLFNDVRPTNTATNQMGQADMSGYQQQPQQQNNPNHQNMLSTLPDGYSGPLPDHMQHSLGNPGASQGMPQGMSQGMSQGMPQQGIPQMTEMGPSDHQMNSMNHQSHGGIPTATANYDDYNQDARGGPSMNPQSENMSYGAQSNRGGEGHGSELPEHLMMSQNSASQPNQTNPHLAGISKEQLDGLGSAAMGDFSNGQGQQGMMGGRRDKSLDFFFLTEEEGSE
jgi:hypothetical protein